MELGSREARRAWGLWLPFAGPPCSCLGVAGGEETVVLHAVLHQSHLTRSQPLLNLSWIGLCLARQKPGKSSINCVYLSLTNFPHAMWPHLSQALPALHWPDNWTGAMAPLLTCLFPSLFWGGGGGLCHETAGSQSTGPLGFSVGRSTEPQGAETACFHHAKPQPLHYQPP